MNLMFHPRVTGNPTIEMMMFDLPPTPHTPNSSTLHPPPQQEASTSEHEQAVQKKVSSQR
ncbi:hypothetical protein [Serinibacter arcticus]|uniref:hypothetical protein n=1 Tax=Serinibacter arcticus TaxID=1655435 RepID=UPI0011B25DB4|nr:hypothetical protein [Serinibacter arcticus]